MMTVGNVNGDLFFLNCAQGGLTKPPSFLFGFRVLDCLLYSVYSTGEELSKSSDVIMSYKYGLDKGQKNQIVFGNPIY